jgi:hypothetical protein
MQTCDKCKHLDRGLIDSFSCKAIEQMITIETMADYGYEPETWIEIKDPKVFFCPLWEIKLK